MYATIYVSPKNTFCYNTSETYCVWVVCILRAQKLLTLTENLWNDSRRSERFEHFPEKLFPYYVWVAISYYVINLFLRK